MPREWSGKTTAQCLAPGCDKLAVYLNPFSRGKGTRRGYCFDHKHMAVSKYVMSDAEVDYIESSKPTFRFFRGKQW